MKIIEDIKFHVSHEKDNKIISIIKYIFFNPCFHAVLLFRISNLLYRLKLTLFAKIIWYINRMFFHCDIDFRANIQGGFELVHGLGVVIGKDVVSEGNLKVYQGVTIGGTGRSSIYNGKEIWQPIIKKNVTLYTNSMVLGPVVLESGTRVKAGQLIK